MFKNLIAALAACSLVFVSACSDNDLNDRGQNGSLLLGGGGGTVSVLSGQLAGTSLEVPTGAVTDVTFLSIEQGQATAEAGWQVVGPAASFNPAAQTFAQDVTLTLPFDPSQLPAGLPDSQVFVKMRDAQGVVRTMRADQVDRMGTVLGTPNPGITVPIPAVSVRLRELGTAWVAVPFVDPSVTTVDLRDYLLLGQGNRYEMSNGLVVTAEPGIGGAPALAFDFAGGSLRIESFDFANDGALFSRGWAGTGFELTHPQLLLRAPGMPTLFDPFVTQSTWELRAPPAAANPIYTGLVGLRSRVDRVDPAEAVRLTGFADVIQLITERTWGVDGLALVVPELEFLWMARGVGVVGFEDPTGAQFALQRAVVDGVEIVPQIP